VKSKEEKSEESNLRQRKGDEVVTTKVEEPKNGDDDRNKK
jgi:hypothetical protein